MKAYKVFPAPDVFYKGCTLVWAESAGKAKSEMLSLYEEEYIQLRARRVPEYDQHRPEGKNKALTNGDLPDDAPPFYDDYLIEW